MKRIQTKTDLAVNGAQPLFENPLHVGCPNIGIHGDFLAMAEDILERKWLTNNGDYVRRLEGKLAEYLGVKHAIAVCNATIGLETVSRALQLSGEVIVPSFTFIATVHSLLLQGINPVFVDIDPHTHNLDPVSLRKLITPKTTGILGVHVWGRPCAIDEVTNIAREYGVKLFFDAAHAFGCSYEGTKVGNFGECEVFSFHATKVFNTFEGGVIVTNNDEFAAKIRPMINFGFQGKDNVVCLGTNGKMTEISAAMGLVNLESVNQFIEINKNNYETYLNELLTIKGIKPVIYNENNENNYQYIVIEVEKEFGCSRDSLCEILIAENIMARRYFHPGCHLAEPYRSRRSSCGQNLFHTEALCQSVLVLPNGAQITTRDVRKICDLIRYIGESLA